MERLENLKNLFKEDSKNFEAAGSVPVFLNIIFALHGGRIRPYYKYLEWELENYPLKKIPMKNKGLIKILLEILEDADIDVQQKLFSLTEKVFRKEGYGKVFDSWGADEKGSDLQIIKKFTKNQLSFSE